MKLRFLTICSLVTLLFLAILAANMFYFARNARAQSGGYSGTGKEVFCRGDRDYESFISAFLSYDGFIEYWKDIVIRYNANICLYNDIDSLLRRLEKARQQVRNAFYICDVNANNLAKTYYKLEAELYFARKYLDVSNGNLLFADEKALRNKFIDYFVTDKEFFTQEEGKNYFDEFLKRYKERQKVYLNCPDPTWGNLIAKWNEFKENAGGFGAIKEAVETIKQKAEKVLNVPRDRTGNVLGGLIDVRVNDLDPETAGAEISNELKRIFPDGYTFGQLQTAKNSAAKRYKEAVSRAEFLTQYEHLYKESSGDIINEIVARLDTLNVIIKSTIAGALSRTYQCTKTVNYKTC